MGSLPVQNTQLNAYGITSVTVNAAGSSYAIDFSLGNLYRITLDQATCNLSSGFTNPPPRGQSGTLTVALKQPENGSSTVSAWPSSVVWSAGSAPTLSTRSEAVDLFQFTTIDGGVTWYGVVVSANSYARPGRLWVSGLNNLGQLGLGDTTSRTTFTRVGSLTTWYSYATGYAHTVVTHTDGTLWTWGNNSVGQLGLADTADRSSPTQVGALTTWWVVGHPGAAHTPAICTDGTLWAWGDSPLGQLGLGDTIRRSSPTQVGSLTTWSSVFGTVRNTLATGIDGTLWAWGSNNAGQLGMGDTVSRSSPVQVGTLTTWSGILAGGYNFSATTRTDGTLWAWGYNSSGQLGVGDKILRSSPTQIGALTTWLTVSGSSLNTFAIRTNGTLWAWGDDTFGQLGLGSTTSYSSPVQVGTLTTWSSVAGGSDATGDAGVGYFTTAIRTDGTFWVWGVNTNGQLGLGDTISRSSPTQVGTANAWTVAGGGGAADSGAISYTIPNTSLWTWGSNTYGQLGLGDTNLRSSPVQIGALTTWSAISGGLLHFVGLRQDGTLWSWGHNDGGQLGQGNTADYSTPTQIGTLVTWSSISSNNGHYDSSAIRTDGTLWIWGYNSNGECGLGDTAARLSPTQLGALTTWSNISCGDNHTHAIRTDGTLWAMGAASYGMLGLGDTAPRSSPTQVGALATWSKVAAGGWHSIAIKTDGTLWALGGRGDTGASGAGGLSPIQLGTATTWSSVSCGYYHAAAIQTNGTLWSWGDSDTGECGTGNTGRFTAPVQVGTLTTWTSVSCGYYNNSATRIDGTIWVWGVNGSGELGLGDTVTRSSPVQVGAITTWSGVGDGSAISGALSSVWK